jgi:hypothetical protein
MSEIRVGQQSFRDRSPTRIPETPEFQSSADHCAACASCVSGSGAADMYIASDRISGAECTRVVFRRRLSHAAGTC